ncbi:MAG: acyl-CoA thioesterase [Actinobacteria bacterium]|nr:acyl-CoA thioesterase [Actinomycetota bacterium]
MVVVPVYRRFSDLDPLGHVNNVVYHDYLQEARVVQMNDIGAIVNTDFAQIVVKQEIRHIKPLSYSREPIMIEVSLTSLTRATYSLAYRILDENGELVAEATSQLAVIDPTSGRPIRIPEVIAERLKN